MGEAPPDDARTLVERLYDTHGAALYRYAALLLADAAAAEDVVQQVFTTMLRLGFRPEEEAHYLRRAVRNACYSHLRRRRRHVETDAHPALLEAAAEGTAPEERLALEQALRGLPPEQREVLHLHVFEGLTFREIAGAWNVSINTIAARYRYALDKLRQLLTARDAG